MTGFRWVVLIFGSVAIIVGAVGLFTHSTWSDAINVGFIVFGAIVSLIQVVLWITPSPDTSRIMPPSPEHRATVTSDIPRPGQHNLQRIAPKRLSAQRRTQSPFKLLSVCLVYTALLGLILLGSYTYRRITNTPIVLYSASSPMAVSWAQSSYKINALAWSPDDRYIATADNDGKVRVWDGARKRIIVTYTGHTGAVYALAWSHDGTRIASGGNDDTVQIWTATTGQKIITYSGHTDTVNAVTWSPHDTRIASASDDNTVKVWDVIDGTTVYTYTGHHSGVTSIAWSFDGTRIASVANENKNEVQVWDATTGGHILTFSSSDPNSLVDMVAWAPDNTRIAFNIDNTVQIKDATTLGKIVSIVCSGHKDTVNAMTWSPDSKYIASGDNDGTVKVCDSTTGDNIATYKISSASVSSLVWASDDRRIATAGSDGTIQIWDALSGKQLLIFH
jgi:WD40 repeat protein